MGADRWGRAVAVVAHACDTGDVPAALAVPDAACAAAVGLARAAAEVEAGDPSAVGEHLGVEAEGDRLVVHRFVCEQLGYRGWQWTVVVTRAARAKVVTVDDVVLLAGPESVVGPAWVPWAERLRPGDLGVGDLLPTAADDERLALRVSDVDGWVDTDLYLELGLGRPRVLSDIGRAEAAERWVTGDSGPDTPMAKAAPGRCVGCGFFVRLVGGLGRLAGVCANEMAPDDGRVVAVDHGCGAHSEALVLPPATPELHVPTFEAAPEEPEDVAEPAAEVAELAVVVVEAESAPATTEGELPLGHAAGSVDAGDAAPEGYGHS
jgi:Protein of unknown function (DUF3027)